MKVNACFGPAMVLLLFASAAQGSAGHMTNSVDAQALYCRGQPFDIRVSRVPGFPGGWFSPTLRLRVSYPVSPGWAYTQTDERTIAEFSVIRIDASLLPPLSLYPDPEGSFESGGTIRIVALVIEPTSGQETRTLCTATSVMAL